MKISVNWLKEFVEIASAPRQLKSDLTMIGLNTEAVAQVGDDWVLDVEVTTNRPDCLSHYGVARELATLYHQPLKKLEFAVKESGGPAQGVVSIEISDPDLCARYCGRVVQNVRVGPSPDWLVKRLEAVGQRPINNVADVTNYVLMELGHPLHAFDLSRLKQQKIIVRRAKPGEPLRTLDGVARTLTRDNLVIADGAHPVALAGVMGGEESEIATSTRSVLLESAWFEPVSIRRTSKSQGMHTEASHRFERGADIQMAPLALDRTAALIQEIAGGEILAGMIDVYPRPIHRPDLSLAPSEITRILGAEIPGEEVERILRGLGFQVEPGDGASWRVSVPSFRVDVSREVDLVEEVARHIGYDRLPARVRPAPPSVERDTTRDKVITISSLLVGLGFHEIITTSMVDPAEGGRFSASAPVILANPLSQDASAMRSSAVPSMLRAIRWNLDRDTNDVRLFELGKTYSMSAKGVPEEQRVLTLGATGHRRPGSVYDSEALLDFFDLKGDLETIFGAFDVPALVFEPFNFPYLQQGRSGRLSSRGIPMAVLGPIQQDLARDYKLRQDVWMAEIDFERLLEFPLRSRKFQPISKFPAVERDFSLVLPDDLPYARLASAVAGLALEEIRDFRPVDRFRGGTISPGHYSLLLRVDFQSLTHTLTSEEVNQLSERVLVALEPLGVRLRS
jgi:phenylalanyl-tRNA synthetase beta chain